MGGFGTIRLVWTQGINVSLIVCYTRILQLKLHHVQFVVCKWSTSQFLPSQVNGRKSVFFLRQSFSRIFKINNVGIQCLKQGLTVEEIHSSHFFFSKSFHFQSTCEIIDSLIAVVHYCIVIILFCPSSTCAASLCVFSLTPLMFAVAVVWRGEERQSVWSW